MELAAGPMTQRPDGPGREAGALDADSLDASARAAAGGDVAAFERVYHATVARVHSLARRLLGRARADEATQEVYLRAWRGLAGWRGDARASTWLFALARNALIDLAERREPERAASAALDEHAAASARPLARLELEEAIEALPAGARAVFVLHDVEGLLHAEIAARLGISTGTSKSQLHRARMLLRAALGEGRKT